MVKNIYIYIIRSFEMETIDETKQNVLDCIKKNYPNLDPSGVELMYEQDKKAYEDHIKHIEELNKQLNPSYN